MVTILCSFWLSFLILLYIVSLGLLLLLFRFSLFVVRFPLDRAATAHVLKTVVDRPFEESLGYDAEGTAFRVRPRLPPIPSKF